jgi:Spy/CpxP family protein refolding chaperone
MRHASKALALLLVATTVAGAQDPGRARGRGRGAPGDSMRGPGMVAARQAIEKLIRTQVQPTDDQLSKLRQIDQQFTPRRIDLDREEQRVRLALRQAMLDSTGVDEAKISQLLDRMVAFPGRRAALMEEEQKSLAQVLSPLQRAKFNAIQEQIRRRVEQGRGGPPQGRGRPPKP